MVTESSSENGESGGGACKEIWCGDGGGVGYYF